MGVLFSIFNHCNEVKSEFDEYVIVKSISFGDEEGKTLLRSISFKGRDSEPLILKSSGSGKMIFEGSVSFKGREFETKLLVNSPLPDEDRNSLMKEVSPCCNAADVLTPRSHCPISAILDPNNPKHAAAIKLQKVYKSFRTRRKLADCAVLVEQSWWKLLDFAELKRSSISFFDVEKHETAVSRWLRARKRAAKVGKGLSKNEKAQKLALQHWLEAIDPRHRYGHNLHLYYDKWLHCQSQQPFFYWLDVGEGKEINLVDTCPRSKLQRQCIKYLGPIERKAYKVIVEDGRFFYKQTGELLNTTGDAKWIFVLSTSKTLYVGKKLKGTFQHSSFLAGGATTAAGRLVIESGVLKAVWPHSGHYRPTEENFKEFISFLGENHVDLKEVKMSPMDDDECSIVERSSSTHISRNSTEFDLAQAFNILETDEMDVKDSAMVESDSEVLQTGLALEQPKSSLELGDKTETKAAALTEDLGLENPSKQMVEAGHVESIPSETILQRINSKKGLKSYQLGKQLSCKWTTGAGPRIGCVRDYPAELQFQALEQVNLSPKGDNHPKSYLSPRSTSCLSPRLSIRRSTSEEISWPASPMLKKQNSLRRRIQANAHSFQLRDAPVAALTNA